MFKRLIQRSSTETLQHIRKMRAASKLAADVLDELNDKIRAGATTNELNEFCHNMIVSRGGTSAVLNYHGFPKSICASVNNMAAHGVPNDEPLKDGDLLKLDVSVKLDGVFGDSCRTYFVGKPSARAKNLTIATYNAMMAGIQQVKPGNTIGDIGFAIHKSLEGTGCVALREFTGHGIGQELHMEPSIHVTGASKMGQVLEPGMIFTIEPVVVEGNDQRFWEDKNGIIVSPHRLAAHFEHTVMVTEKGCDILSDSPKKLYVPAEIRKEVVHHKTGFFR